MGEKNETFSLFNHLVQSNCLYFSEVTTQKFTGMLEIELLSVVVYMAFSSALII